MLLQVLSELHVFLQRHGVSESDPVFSNLKERASEGAQWLDATKRSMPPSSAEYVFLHD